jgi:hypothetical protein
MSFETTFARRDDVTRAALGTWESEGGAGGRAMVFALWDTATQTVLGVWPSEDGALAAVRVTRDRGGPGAAATWALVGDNPDGEAGILAHGDALGYRATLREGDRRRRRTITKELFWHR